jgi:hypothetical protein
MSETIAIGIVEAVFMLLWIVLFVVWLFGTIQWVMELPQRIVEAFKTAFTSSPSLPKSSAPFPPEGFRWKAY